MPQIRMWIVYVCEDFLQSVSNKFFLLFLYEKNEIAFSK